MDLETKEGFVLVKTDEVHKMKEISCLIIVVRNSMSKTWRLMDKLDKLLREVTQ